MFQESARIKKWTELIFSLHEHLECPVCQDVPTSSVKQCSNGHITCMSCANSLEKCSLCQQAFSVQNSTCLNNVLNALPRICIHSGCKELFLSSDNHEEFCGFRRIPCIEEECEEEVEVCKMKSHYDEKHTDSYVKNVERFQEKKVFLNDFNPNDYRKSSKIIFLDENFIRILEEYIPEENKLRVTFIVFPVGESGADYNLKIKLKKGLHVFSKTLDPLVMTEFKHDDELEWDENMIIEIPQCVLSRFLDESQRLAYTFKLIKHDSQED